MSYKLPYHLIFPSRFVETKLPVLKTLNPNTYFVLSELSSEYKTPGYVSVVFRNPDKHNEWEHAHIRPNKTPILPEIPVEEQDEDLTVIEGENMPVEWWEQVSCIVIYLR